MSERLTLTRKIIRHRGFIPVTFLIFLSVLASGVARFSDHQQGRLNKDGIETVAVVTEKNISTSRATDNKMGGVKIVHWVVLQFSDGDGKLYRIRRSVGAKSYEGISKGDRFHVRYDPKNPRVFQMSEDEFGDLADKIRILAWVFFGAGCLLAAHHFLQYWLSRRRNKRAR